MGTSTRKTAGLRLKGSVYYADTTANGVRLSQRIGKVSERDAKAILAEMVSRAFKEEYFPAKDQQKSTTLNIIMNEYCTKKLDFVKSCDTRSYLFIPLGRLLGNHVAKDLRISNVEEYRRIRLTEKKTIGKRKSDKPVSISTVNHEVKELLIALQWAVRERLLEYNPIAGIEHLKEPAPAKIMLDKGVEDGSDWTRLYNGIGERNRFSGKLTLTGKKNRLKFLIQYKTGMRIGEINAIEHTWIDQFGMRINLPAEATKASKSRVIPIDMELVQAITDFRAEAKGSSLAHDKYLFFNIRTGTHDNRSYKAFNNAVARAGLSKGITSHALRRTRGTIWDGIDERASMEVLGHSDTKVHRKHYTEVTQDRIDNLINKPEINKNESEVV